jgi:6-pyruvoyl-tetrahydropterin synthase-like protein
MPKFNFQKHFKFANFIAWLLVLLSFFIAIKPYLNKRFPYTHDGENHLARFANYKVAVKEGQFPARFAPNLMNHYGYPTFNYNYPLANILSLPFSFLKINYELSFKIIAIGFILLGAVGVNKWLKLIGIEQKMARKMAIAAFLLNPYLINLTYFRGNIGEIMALNLLPWLLLIVEWIKANKISKNKINFKIILIMIAFLLSHNISVLFGTIFALIYAVLRFRKNSKLWKQAIVYFLFGIGLTFWFWLPAILEKNQIILDNVDLSKGFTEHSPTLSQLFFAPIQFGFSYISSIDTISFSLGFTQIMALILMTIVLFKEKLLNKSANSQKDKTIKFLIIGAWILILLQLKISQLFLKLIPLSFYIQFPWRFTMFFEVIIVAYLYNYSQKCLKHLLIGIIFLQAFSYLKLKPADYFHRTNVDYDAFTQSTSTNNENLPKTFSYQEIADWQPGPAIFSGNGIIEVIKWQGSEREYQLSLEEETIIVEPTMNFLGWQTIVTDIISEENHNFKVEYLDSDEIQGRIAYILPAGEYDIKSKFTQKTPARIIGNSISLITLLFLIISKAKSKFRIQNEGK